MIHLGLFVWAAWNAFWTLIDGFFVPQMVALVIVLFAFRYVVRGYKKLRSEIETEDVQ